MKQKQTKKKTLEDIIPLKSFIKIIATANFLKEIETIGKDDAEYFWKHSIAAREHLNEIFGRYNFDDENSYHQTLNQISDMQDYLRIKSELESMICEIQNGEPVYKRKKRGLHKNSYASDYLVASLAAETKRITGKANYDILEEYLQRHKEVFRYNMVFPRFCGHIVKLGCHSLQLKRYRRTIHQG